VLEVSWAKEKEWNYYYAVLVAACCVSVFSRPVARANLIVARTASIFGVHVSGSDGALPPR
jgi:hypothetical protein